MSFAFPRARKGAVVLAGLAAGTVLALTPTAANAAPARPSGHATPLAASPHQPLTAKQRKHRHYVKQVHKVLHVAAKQKGDPYVFGADGPGSFDCSGLVRFVFEHAVGRSLPHNAAEQYSVSNHIERRHLRRGDLVFVDDGGSISHVGIYAGRSHGHRYWWVAPHSGETVHRQRIYQAHFVYGRILHWH